MLLASVFTPEAISGKTFQRLTKEKATLAREIDKRKTLQLRVARSKCIGSGFAKENPKNTQCVSAIA